PAGLVEDQIADLARRYTPATPLPTPPYLSWCRNPATGEFCERQLDPYAAAATLRAAGFHAEVRHGFRRRPLSLLNAAQLRPLNRALFELSPLFILVATKPVGAPKAA